MIGRGASADVSLRATDASRRRARISRRDDGFVIEDLGSVNGTFVNGVALQGETRVRIGDRIEIGASAILALTVHDELEARLQQLQKLESMASLIAGRAHDFNNSPMVIWMNLSAIEGRSPSTVPS